MALRGNLKDFSLPDVFQLVTFSKKTGVLRIRRADGIEGSVWFRDGDVFFAQSNWHHEPLGQRMVSAQKITPSALDRALEIRRAEGDAGRRLGQILVDEGYISDKMLEAFVQEQIQDTIFDLMRWDEGDFDFEAMPAVVDEDIGLSVSIENIVMEGARRLEEWTRIKKKVPSMDIVFKMATAPGEGTFEISLKPIEWQLLLLVDGTRSVSELATETARTDFDVARIIYGLFSAGLLEIAADDEVEKLRADRAVRDEKLASIRRESEFARKAKAARPAAEPKVEAPREEPEFLTGGAKAATAEDMAVFEQMMGAVLETPEAAAPLEPEPQAPEEPPAPEPEPAEEAFMAVELPAEVAEALPAEQPAIEPEQGPAPEFAPEPEPPIEPVVSLETETTVDYVPEPPSLEPIEPDESLSDLLGMLNAADEATGVESAPMIEQPPAELAAPELADEAEFAEIPAAEIPAEPESDLARDLMALGLGELSGDLLQPAEPASVMPPEETGMVPAEPEPAEEVPTIAELEAAMSLEGVPAHEAWATPEPEVAEVAPDLGLPEAAIEPDAALEPEFAIEPAEPAIEPGPELAIEPAIEPEPEPQAELPPFPQPEAEADESEPDFADLLSSLEGPVESDLESSAMISTETFEEGEAPTTGVISTDAFLDEIGGDMDLGTGIGDELTALTGGGGVAGRVRPRPVANVKRIPEPGAAEGLRMDQTVDKELVLRIIDGIKEL